MSVTDSEQTLESPVVATPAAAYETCEQCEAPVDANQRYCVVCGTHRRHVYDPAARFLADATSRSRSASRAGRGAGAGSSKRRSPGLGLALALALIPVAVAVGALVANRGNDSNSKLLAALRAEKPTVRSVRVTRSNSRPCRAPGPPKRASPRPKATPARAVRPASVCSARPISRSRPRPRQVTT